jgi:Transcriptional regulator, contains sigma factor-related N-terminal domain
MSPRNLRVTFTALGIRQNDPHVLHAHPNTLVTLLWLLYAPRAEAHLVGSRLSVWASGVDMPNREYPRYFVVGSCDRFDPNSSFSKLLGDEGTAYLLEKEASGDFAYAFLGREGLIGPPPSGDHTFVGAERLKALSKRKDARVILVAGGPGKLPTTRVVLMNGLCNVLVTDKESSRALLKGSEGGYGQQKRYPRDLSPNS